MAFPLSDYLVADDLTLLLGLIAITIFLLRSLYRPQPLVHPILLGRQSDVARVRLPGESAVYRNYGTGAMGRFPHRPGKDVSILSDLIKPDFDGRRTLWSAKITNTQLKNSVEAFAAGLVNVAKLVPNESSVFILLDDCLEFLIADLALASLSVTSITKSSVEHLSSVLEFHPHAAIIVDAKDFSHVIGHLPSPANRTVIVTGGRPRQEARGVNLLTWTEVQDAGSRAEKMTFPSPSPSDVFTIAYYSISGGDDHRGVQLTHENLTAGVAAIRGLFPISNQLSSLDIIASAFSLRTPFGRAIAYTALYEGAGFSALEGTGLFDAAVGNPRLPSPSPTVLFTVPRHVEHLTSAILKHAREKSLLHLFAWRHKEAGLADGFITKESLWDRLLFDNARAEVLEEGAGTLRAIVVSGGTIESTLLTSARIAFSVPLVNAHTHPVVAAPILASHGFDVQRFPITGADAFSTLAHVGPPGINVEVKLTSVNDEEIEKGGDPEGVLVVRGPPVGKVVGSDADWVDTGNRAKVLTNGSFKVL